MTHLTHLTPACPHQVLYLTDCIKIFVVPLRHEVSSSASFLSGSRDLGFVCFWRLMVSTHVETRAGILYQPRDVHISPPKVGALVPQGEVANLLSKSMWNKQVSYSELYRGALGRQANY